MKSARWLGAVCGPRVALGVGVARSERSVAAVTSAKAKPDASSRRAAAQPQRRATVRKVQARSKPQVVNDGDGTSMHQRRVDAARSEGARALPERDRIAKAQAAERARQQAVQLQAERGAAAERQHAQKRARIEAAKQAKQAAAAERKRDADALRAAEQAAEAGYAARYAALRRRGHAAAVSSSSMTTSGSLWISAPPMRPPLPTTENMMVSGCALPSMKPPAIHVYLKARGRVMVMVTG